MIYLGLNSIWRQQNRGLRRTKYLFIQNLFFYLQKVSRYTHMFQFTFGNDLEQNRFFQKIKN